MERSNFLTQRISEIDSLIQQVKIYQEISPEQNPFIQNRLAYLDENPCTTGLYYVNAYLNPDVSGVAFDPAVLKRYIQTIQVEVPIKQFFDNSNTLTALITTPSTVFNEILTGDISGEVIITGYSYVSSFTIDKNQLKVYSAIINDKQITTENHTLQERQNYELYTVNSLTGPGTDFTTFDNAIDITDSSINMSSIKQLFVDFNNFLDNSFNTVLSSYNKANDFLNVNTQLNNCSNASGYMLCGAVLSNLYDQYWHDTNKVCQVVNSVTQLWNNAKFQPPKLFNLKQFTDYINSKLSGYSDKIKNEKLDFWLSQIVSKIQNDEYYTLLETWKQVYNKNNSSDAFFGKYIELYKAKKQNDCGLSLAAFFETDIWNWDNILGDSSGPLSKYYKISPNFLTKTNIPEYWINHYKEFKTVSTNVDAITYFIYNIWMANNNPQGWVPSFADNLENLIFQVSYGPSAVIPDSVNIFDNLSGGYKLKQSPGDYYKGMYSYTNNAQTALKNILSGCTELITTYNVSYNNTQEKIVWKQKFSNPFINTITYDISGKILSDIDRELISGINVYYNELSGNIAEQISNTNEAGKNSKFNLNIPALPSGLIITTQTKKRTQIEKQLKNIQTTIQKKIKFVQTQKNQLQKSVKASAQSINIDKNKINNLQSKIKEIDNDINNISEQISTTKDELQNYENQQYDLEETANAKGSTAQGLYAEQYNNLLNNISNTEKLLQQLENKKQKLQNQKKKILADNGFESQQALNKLQSNCQNFLKNNGDNIITGYSTVLGKLQSLLVNINKLLQLSINASYRMKADSPYKAVFIDTINYDVFGDLQWNLQKVKMSYESLPPDTTNTVEQKSKEVQSDGKLIQRKPYCSWFKPLNYFEIFNIDNPLSWFNELLPPVSGYQLDQDGNRMISGFTSDGYPKYSILFKQPALQNGYMYVPMGVTIQTQYTGVPVTPDSILIPGVGMQYGSLLGGFVKPRTKKDMQNSLLYPYQNNIPSGQYFWLQNKALTKKDYQSLKNMFSGNSKPIWINYDVYLRKQIVCGYPKVDPNECSTEQSTINGRCGLKQFFNQPFSFKKHPLSAKQIKAQLQLRRKKWQMVRQRLSQSNLTQDKLQQQKAAKKISSNMFMQQARNKLSQFSILPKECMNVFCRAQRKMFDEDQKNFATRMGDDFAALSQIALQTGKAAFQLGAAALGAGIAVGTAAVGAIWGTGTAIVGAFGMGRPYQYCPRMAEQTVNNTIRKFFTGSIRFRIEYRYNLVFIFRYN